MRTFEAVYELVRGQKGVLLIGGDFNSPQAETREGDHITWGQRIRPDGSVVFASARGEEWHQHEWNLLKGTQLEGLLVDSYRTVHGYETSEGSWHAPKSHTPRRYDSQLGTPVLNPIQAQYHQEFRTTGLSDHAPIEVTYQPLAGWQKQAA